MSSVEYSFLFPDYICDENDIAIIQSVVDVPAKKKIIRIDDSFVVRVHLQCLLDPNAFLWSDVSSSSYLQTFAFQLYISIYS